MNSASMDIKDLLEANSLLKLTFGTNLFIGKEPAEPDSCTTIFDVGNAGSDVAYSKSEQTNRPTIVIQSRGTSYQAVSSLMQDIKDELHGAGNVTINGTIYLLINCSVDPYHVGWDEEGRKLTFEAVFDIQRTNI